MNNDFMFGKDDMKTVDRAWKRGLMKCQVEDVVALSSKIPAQRLIVDPYTI